ncbi:MAG: alginate export family protein [Candidatus Hinthialibacter antarcticus]|nr:alginate export family protein [Candidatus Hinthialibacter antarcticus]
MGRKLALIAIIVGCFGLTPSVVCAEDTISFWDDSVSIGGEVRGRGEFSNNFYTADGLSARDDEFFLLRSKLHLDVHPSELWRVYVELQDSRQFESDFANRRAVPNGFEDDLDLFQGYFDLYHIMDSPVSLRVGRQILSYGKQRLVGGFLWSNVARSFDAVKVTVDLPDFYGGSIDVFAGEPVTHDWGNFNDVLDNSNQLYGVYSTWSEVEFVDFLEAYYLLRVNDDVDDEVHSIGSRLGRKYDSNIDWEIEIVGQLGDFRGLDHSAFASHVELGYSPEMAWSPRFAIAHNYATGDDDAGDGDHGTFDNLYPTNHLHYGQMDRNSWRNGHDIELEASVKPLEKLKVVSEVHFFILDESEDDAWYNAGGGVIRAGAPGADSYIGTEFDLSLSYQVCDNFAVGGGYSHFFAGAFIDDTGDDDDADWGYIQATVTF